MKILLKLKSPSRTERDEIIALYPYGRGQGVGSTLLAHAPPAETGVGRLAPQARKIPLHFVRRGACPRRAIKSLR